jgi:DNA replicative helicase MCM subunit Mcm2 (Cdc46/Mcm family)
LTSEILPTRSNSGLQYEKAIGEDQNLKLVESITNNTKHYIDLFSDAVDKVMPKESKEITYVLNFANPSHNAHVEAIGSKMMSSILSCRSERSATKPCHKQC